MDVAIDSEGKHRHVQRLVQLQHWARPLALPAGRVTFHVLEAPDPAPAILDYARANRVDHVVIGSRGASSLRRYLGSVSTQVVAEAVCTVTVVKVAAEERVSA
jgi:nucleotide-binding universal stress UspA family protein